MSKDCDIQMIQIQGGEINGSKNQIKKNGC